MSTVAFDTLKLAKGLESAGFSHEQSVKTAEVLAENLGGDVVTKSHLDMRLRELEHRIQANLIKWLVPLLLGQAALVVALIKLL